MKRLIIILAMLLSVCSWRVMQRGQAWRPPAWKQVDFYISEYRLRCPSDATFSPNTDAWKPDDGTGAWRLKTFGTTAGSSKGTKYGVQVAYLGPEGNGDRYLVTITHPGAGSGAVPEPLRVTFRGAAVELWRDDVCAIGVRLKQPLNASPPGQKPRTLAANEAVD